MKVLVGCLISLIVCSGLWAELSSADINAALDLTERGDWLVDAEDGISMEVIEVDGAVGGTALKLTLPGRKDLWLRRLLEGPHLVHFRYKLDEESDENAIYVLDQQMQGREYIALDGDAKTGWKDYRFEYDSKSNPYFGWSSYTNGSSSERTILYLDNLELESGFSVEIRGVGLTVSVDPEKALYAPGEYIRLEAIETEESVEFHKWTDGDADLELENGYYYLVDSHADLVASGRRIVDWDDVSLRFPLLDYDVAIVEANGSKRLEVRELKTSRSNPKFFMSANGPGVVTLSARRLEGASTTMLGNSYLYDTARELAFESETQEFYPFTVTLQGGVSLDLVEFRPGYEFTVEEIGGGSVVGIPEGGTIQEGESVTLKAVAIEGWEFDRWVVDRLYEYTGETLWLKGGDASLVTALFSMVEVVDGISVHMEADGNWRREYVDGGVAFAIDLTDSIDFRGGLSFDLEGPGLLRFSYENAGYAFDLWNNGEIVQSLDPNAELEAVELEVPLGLNRIRLKKRGSGNVPIDVDFRLEGLAYERGFPVVVGSTVGGRVKGLPASGRAWGGETLRLEAKSDASYVFAGWRGDRESESSLISFEVQGPVSLEAVFESGQMKEIEGDPIFTKTRGAKEWSKQGGKWVSPSGLGEGDVATLIGEVTGPGRLYFEKVAGSKGSFSVRIGDGQPLTLGEYVTIPSGVHSVYLSATVSENGDYAPLTFEALEMQYPVFLNSPNALLTTNPQLEDVPSSWEPQIWSGWLSKGTRLKVSLSVPGTMEFVGWSGDLEGLSNEDEIEVDGPISASSLLNISDFNFGGANWEVIEGAGGLSRMNHSQDTVSLNGLAGSVSLAAEVKGPGIVELFRTGLYPKDVSFSIDGEDASDLSGGSSVLIEEGEHELVLTLRIPDHWPVGGFNANGNAYGIIDLRFSYGYFFRARGSFGGSVDVRPDKLFLEPGETVVVEAIPEEGYVFKGWLPPYEGEAARFSVSPSEHGGVVGVFERNEDSRLDEWTLSGPRPDYWESANNGPQLRWSLGASNGRSGSAIAEFSGPGRLDMFESRYASLSTQYVIKMDGVEIYDGRNWTAFDPTLEANETREISWEFGPSEFQEAETGYLVVPIPEVRSQFSVTAKLNSEVSEPIAFSLEPQKEVYSYGEIVTIKTDAKDADGKVFNGWWTVVDPWSGNPELVFGEPEQRFRVDDDLELEAVFRESLDGYDDFVLKGLGESEGWTESEVETPLGGKALATSKSSNFRVYVAKDSLVSFSLRVAGNNRSKFEIRRRGKLESTVHESSEWLRYSLFVRAGSYADLNYEHKWNGIGYFGDLVVEEGWAPSLVYPAEVYLEIETEAAGGFKKVGVPVSLQDRFEYWNVDGEEPVFEDLIRVAKGDEVLRRAYFGKEWQTESGAEFWLSPMEAWSPASTDEESMVWRGTTSLDDRTDASFRAVVNGPASLQAYVEVVDVPVDLFAMIDGDFVWFDNLSKKGERQVALNIPSGLHEVEFGYRSNVNASIEISGIDIAPGYIMEDRSYVGGKTRVSPSGSRVLMGDKVRVSANPDFGYEFVGWRGRFAGNEQVFFVDMDPDWEYPYAEFRVKDTQMEIFGFLWELDGLVVKPPSFGASNGWKTKSLNPEGGSMRTRVQGPSVLRLGSSYRSSDRLKINGVVADDLDMIRVTQGNEYYIGLPAGSHELEVTFSGGFTLSPSIEVLDGFLVEAACNGGTADIYPNLLIYPRGTRVEAKASVGGLEDRVRWSRLPEGASLVGEKVVWDVNSHASVLALVDRSVDIGDIELSYEGSEWILSDRPSRLGSLEFRGEGGISLKVSESGLLHLDLHSNYSSSLRVFATYKGERRMIESYRSRSTNRYRAIVTVDSPGDEVLLEFEVSDYWYGPTVETVFLDEARLDSERALPPYVGWWFERTNSVIVSLADIDPKLDLDGDGLPNYQEYLADTNPQVGTEGLTIRFNEETRKVELSFLTIEGELAQSLVLERKSRSAGWKKLSGSNAENRRIDGRVSLRVIEDWDGEEGIQLYRYGRKYGFPSFGDLLEDLE